MVEQQGRVLTVWAGIGDEDSARGHLAHASLK